ncbi:MAG TPA: hypothetical protein VHY22_05860 [Chthoniobacteraceae bacterium]|jgi:uncharacterized protein (TIGR02598 family)|nr:hypothetical protein [Chthoniobacteraceae bacterium]
MPPHTPLNLARFPSPARSGRIQARARRSAFTLIEVCVALGVMVFAATAMLGLLSTGITRLGGQMDASQGQNILQQVLIEARQMPFPQLAAMGTYKRYFTYEGDMFDTSGPQTVYTAIVTVGGSTPPPGGATPSTTLATLTVQIRKTPGGIDAHTNPPIANYVSMASCPDLTLMLTGS